MRGRGGRLAGPFPVDRATGAAAALPGPRGPRTETETETETEPEPPPPPPPPSSSSSSSRRRARAAPASRSPPDTASAWPRAPREEEEAAAAAMAMAMAAAAAAAEKGAAKRLQAKRRAPLKPKGGCRKRDPLPYASGSLEEQWHLAILDKGRVTCPVCRVATRKTVEGLKKHMANCQQEMFTCHHCGKQLRSLAGMKYHLMADHNTLLMGKEKGPQDKQSERERLRQVLKRLGKLRCTREGCTGSFTSIVGYLYHTQKCGKAAAELETLVLRCPHCGKAYRSRAGLVYHMKSEHGPAPFLHKDTPAGPPKDACTEPNSGRRLQRKSAKVAAYYLHELAHVELAKEWPKRKVLQDLVPDDRKLKYTRPGLPTVSQEVLCKWRAEIKAYQQVQCPNQGCTCVYSSVSGLKAHLGSCTLGEFVAGKYRCRLCTKEFVSESGVKYHINAVHAEDWFEVSTTGSKRLAKQARPPPQPEEATRATQQQNRRKKALTSHNCRKRRLPPLPPPPPSAISPKRPPRLGLDPSQHPGTKAGRSRAPGSESWSSSEEAALRPQPTKPSHKRGRK